MYIHLTGKLLVKRRWENKKADWGVKQRRREIARSLGCCSNIGQTQLRDSETRLDRG